MMCILTLPHVVTCMFGSVSVLHSETRLVELLEYACAADSDREDEVRVLSNHSIVVP